MTAKIRILTLCMVFLVLLPGAVTAGIRFGTGSAVNHRVETLDRRLEEQQRLAAQAVAAGSSQVVHLADRAHITDSETVDALVYVSADSAVIEFSSTTAQLASLTVGDVLVVMPSDSNALPLLRKITGIEALGAGLRFITVQAALTDVIKEADLDVNYTFTAADFAANNTPHMAPRRPTRAAGPSMAPVVNSDLPSITTWTEGGRLKVKVEYNNFIIYDEDDDANTTFDQVTVSGSLTFFPSSFHQLLKIRPQVSTMEATGEIVKLELLTYVELEGNVKIVYGLSDSWDAEKRWPFFSLKYPQVPLVIPPPPAPPVPIAWFTPELSVIAGVEGKLSAGAVFEKTFTINGYLSATWTPENGTTISRWPKLEFDKELIGGINVTGEVTGYVGLNAAAYFESVAGIKVNCGMYSKFEANIGKAPYPWYKMTIGLFGGGGPALYSEELEDQAEDVLTEYLGVRNFFNIRGEWPIWSYEVEDTGILKVVTNASGAQIYLDNALVSSSGSYLGRIPTGNHIVHYGPVPGMLTPADRTVTITSGDVTTIQDTYYSPAYLNITTNTTTAPIYVDNVLVGYGSVNVATTPAFHTVRFGDLANCMFLADNTAWPVDPRVFFPDTVAAGFLTHNILTGTTVSGMTYNINGNYVAAGRLEVSPSWWDTVTTSVFAITAINGQAVTPTVSYGQDALTPVGNYTFTFSLAPGLGYINPYAAVPPNQPQSVGNTLVDYWDMEPDTLSFTVIAGSNNQYVFPMIMAVSAGTTGPDGFPGADVYVDGFTWTGLQAMFVVGAPAIHEIRFQDIPGYITPPTVNVLYEPNHFMNVTGMYTP